MQKSGNVEGLIHLAVQLPPLLEITEIVRGSRETDEHVAKGLRLGLLQLEVKFKKWLADYETNGLCAHRIEENTLDSRLDNGIYWLERRPVITVPILKFCSFMDATCHAFHWICVLLLQQALITLSETSPEEDHPRDIFEEVNATADNICAAIPYLIRSAGGPVSKCVSIRAPLHFASEWFEQNGNDLKLQWCRKTEEMWRAQLPFLQWYVRQYI